MTSSRSVGTSFLFMLIELAGAGATGRVLWRITRSAERRDRWRVLRFAAGTILLALLGLGHFLIVIGAQPERWTRGRILWIAVPAWIALGVLIVSIVAAWIERVARRRSVSGEAPPRPRTRTTVDDLTDPGWWPAIRITFSRFLFWRWFRRLAEPDRLVVARMVFLGLVFSLPLFAVALSFLMPFYESNGGSTPAIVVSVALGGWFLARRTRRRPVDVSSAWALAQSYRQRMFLGIPFAQLPGLAGIALPYLADPPQWWIYALGGTCSLGLLFYVGPRRGDIERLQEDITAAGSSLSLLSALRWSTPPEPGSDD